MKRPASPRPQLSAKLPQEVIADLLHLIRHQFYPDASDRVWSCDAYFIKARVILWPATFMVERGFAMRPERYLEVMRDIIKGIQQFGQTEGIKHWPRYLAVCVQRHFQAQWETYYAEAKSVRATAEAAVLALKGAQRDPGEAFVDSMHMTHRLLTGPKRGPKARQSAQGELAL